MARPRKKPALVINASVWLVDEERFTLLEDLNHTPRPGEEFEINGDRWQVVEWTDRIECERANQEDFTITSHFAYNSVMSTTTALDSDSRPGYGQRVRFEVSPTVGLFKDLLIFFPVTSLSVILTSLLIKMSLSPYHIVVSIIVNVLIVYFCQSTKSLRSLLKAVACFALVWAFALVAAVRVVDMEFDSRSYHGPAVIALADGWNPLYDPKVCQWNPDYCTPTNPLIDHYPKAQWLISAAIYLLVGNIDAGKSVNLMMLVLACVVSYEFTMNALHRQRGPSLLATAAIAANPVALAQVSCGYVDGLLASSMTVYAILVIDFLLFSNEKGLIRGCLLLPYLVNIKFTGLVYPAVFTAVLCLAWILMRSTRSRSLVLASTLSFAASVFVFGFNPYVTNFEAKRNPFFPAYQPGTNKDILSKQAATSFLERNRFEKFVIANFSMSRKVDETFEPVFAFPLTVWNSTPLVDARFSGFGPLFSTVLMIIVLQLFLPGSIRLRMFAAVIMITVFATTGGWWARLAPQTWLAVCLLEISGVADRKNQRSGILAHGVMAVLVVNSVIVLCSVGYRQKALSTRFFEHLQIVRAKGCAVQVVDNRYGLFEFYNRRKVIDALDGRAEILDDCASDRRNRIFRICKCF